MSVKHDSECLSITFDKPVIFSIEPYAPVLLGMSIDGDIVKVDYREDLRDKSRIINIDDFQELDSDGFTINLKHSFKIDNTSPLYAASRAMGAYLALWAGIDREPSISFWSQTYEILLLNFKSTPIDIQMDKQSIRFFYNNQKITFQDAMGVFWMSPTEWEDMMKSKVGVIDPSQIDDQKQFKISDIPWRRVWLSMMRDEAADDADIIPENSHHFTKVVYVCPTCKRNLAKQLIKHRSINADGNLCLIDKVFTCKHCHTFFAPLMSFNLDAGELYISELNDEDYKMAIETLDKCARKPGM